MPSCKRAFSSNSIQACASSWILPEWLNLYLLSRGESMISKIRQTNEIMPLYRNCRIIIVPIYRCHYLSWKGRLHYKQIICKYRKNQIVWCTIVWSLYFARLPTLKYVHVRCYLYFLNRIIYKMHCNKCLPCESRSNQNYHYSTHLWSNSRQSFKVKQRKITNIMIREW